jgi:hypothetical protein
MPNTENPNPDKYAKNLSPEDKIDPKVTERIRTGELHEGTIKIIATIRNPFTDEEIESVKSLGMNVINPRNKIQMGLVQPDNLLTLASIDTVRHLTVGTQPEQADSLPEQEPKPARLFQKMVSEYLNDDSISLQDRMAVLGKFDPRIGDRLEKNDLHEGKVSLLVNTSPKKTKLSDEEAEILTELGIRINDKTSNLHRGLVDPDKLLPLARLDVISSLIPRTQQSK